MTKLELSRNIRESVFFRKLLYPFLVLRNCVRKFLFSKSQDSLYIKQFKDKYYGQRCFIIGNGPSLTGYDLDLIKNEISFASNRIYNMYDKTSWRPTFWMCGDYEVIEAEFENIKNLRNVIKFIRIGGKSKKFKKCDNIHKILVHDNNLQVNLNNFEKKEISTECDKYFSGNHSVTCAAIEFAIYMGFKEIYLLGVDHNYPVVIDSIGKKHIDETIKDHFEGGGFTKKKLNSIRIGPLTSCYQAYRDYADANDIKIYNCTRGGKLEVYERKKLEDVINQTPMLQLFVQ